MRTLILTVFITVSIFEYLLKYLTYSRLGDPVPENVKDIYNEVEYAKNQAYQKTNLKFSVVSGLAGTVMTLAFLIMNFHSFLYDYILKYTANIYFTSLFIVLVVYAISEIVDTGFRIYDTFIIEERFGFNKTTVKTFILDFFKRQAISLLLGCGIISLFLFIYLKLGDRVFITFFFIMAAIQIFTAFIAPYLIRVFNKLSPIGDGELKSKIEELAFKSGYKLKGVYMVDASRRSSKLNAFATGFGKTKTIGLYDTLIDKMTDDEIVSILAHEIGHSKKRHILKSTLLLITITGLGFIAAYFIITLPSVSIAFGFKDANIVFGFMVMMIMISPASILLGIPINAMSRKHEYEADAFEKAMMGKEIPISAIKKLYKEDLGNLTPHPFVVMLNHSHPTAAQRIAAFENDDN